MEVEESTNIKNPVLENVNDEAQCVNNDMNISKDDVSCLIDDNMSLEEKENIKRQDEYVKKTIYSVLDRVQNEASRAVNQIPVQSMGSISSDYGQNKKTLASAPIDDKIVEEIVPMQTDEVVIEKFENIPLDIINSIIEKILHEEIGSELMQNKSLEIKRKISSEHKGGSEVEEVGSPSRSSKRKRVPKKMDFNELKKVEDKIAPIPVREKVILETPILWKLADLVWAYVPGHPLWPCMVTLHPEENVSTKMKGNNQRLYHMQFLGDSPERGWVSDLRIFPYTSADDYGKIIADLAAKAKATKPTKSRYKGAKAANSKKIPRLEIPARNKDDWDSAVVEIAEALSCTLEERIQKFAYDFKPFLKQFKTHLMDNKYYSLQELLLMDIQALQLENKARPVSQEEQYDLEIKGVRIKFLGNENLEAIANEAGDKISPTKTVKNRIRVNLKPIEATSSTGDFPLTSAPARMKLWSKPLLPPMNMLNIHTSNEQNSVNVGSNKLSLVDARTIPLHKFSKCQSQNNADKIKRNTSECLTINLEEEDEDVLMSKNKNQTFKELLKLVEKSPADKKEGNGSLISDVRAKNVVTALAKPPGPPTSNYYTKCSCNALDKSRGVGRNCYTLRNLLDAVESVKSGVPSSFVLLNFNIPKSVLLDNVNAKSTLTIKHHFDCNLFDAGSAILIRGNVHHLKAIEDVRSLKIYNKESNQTSLLHKKPKKTYFRKNSGKFSTQDSSLTKLQTSTFKKGKRGRPRKYFDNDYKKKALIVSETFKNNDKTVNHFVESDSKKNNDQKATTSIPNAILPHCSSSKMDHAFSEKQLRHAYLICQKHDFVNQKNSSFYTASPYHQRQVKKGLRFFMNNSTKSVAEIASWYGLEPHFFAENVHFFSQLNNKKDLRKYTLRDIIHAMDDVLYLKQNINKVCHKLQIPNSTLRDCLRRNTEIYNTIITANMTRRERLLALFNNRQKLRVFKRRQNFFEEWDDSVPLHHQPNEEKKNFVQKQTVFGSQRYSIEDFIQAIDEVVKSGETPHKVSKKYNIPFSTLRDCMVRNLPIYKKIVNPNMTKHQRLKALNRNKSMLRITGPQTKIVKMDNTFFKVPKTMKIAKKSDSFLSNLFSAMDEIITQNNTDIADVAKKYNISHKLLKFYVYQGRKKFEQCVNSTMAKSERLNSLLKNKEIFFISECPEQHDCKKHAQENFEENNLPVKTNIVSSFSKSDFISALDVILTGRQGHVAVAKRFNIPTSHIRDLVSRNSKLYKTTVDKSARRSERLIQMSTKTSQLDFGDLTLAQDIEQSSSENDNSFFKDSDLESKNTTRSGRNLRNKMFLRNNTIDFTKRSKLAQSKLQKARLANSSLPQYFKTPMENLNNLVKAIDEVGQGSTVYKSANKYGLSAKKLLGYVNIRSSITKKLDDPVHLSRSQKISSSLQFNKDNFKNIPSTSGVPSTSANLFPTTLVLDKASESRIIKSVKALVDWGWFITLQNIKDLIKEILSDKLSEQINDKSVQDFCQNNSIILTDINKMIQREKPSPVVIFNFFDKLEAVIHDFNLEDRPSHIYSVHSFSLKSCLKNQVTVVAPINALGDRLPPLLIFQGESVWCSGEQNKVYLGTQFALSKDGCLTHKIFAEWFNQFLLAVPQRPLLLMYDGRLNELPSNFISNLAGTNVAVLKYPYCTDLSKFKVPYGRIVADSKKFYSCKVKKKSSDFSQAEITSIVTEMWEDCLSPDTILSGFDTSGIYPANREKYPAETFNSVELHEYCLPKSKRILQGPKPSTSVVKPNKITSASFLKKLKVKPNSLKGVRKDNKGSSIGLGDLVKNLKYQPVKDHLKGLPKSNALISTAIIKPKNDKVLQDALFSSYCKKIKPTMSTQNPELTPEQVESLIWIEWEALSTEEQLLHKEPLDAPTVNKLTPVAPKYRQRGRPRKLSPLPTNVVVTKKDKFPCSSCEENYPTMSSLEQHKRWCAGPRQNTLNAKSPLNHSSMQTQNNKVQATKLSYKCNQCKDMFYSEVSLGVHEKYCTGVASEKSNKTKQNASTPKTKILPVSSSKKKSTVLSSGPQDDAESTGSKEEDVGLIKKCYFKGPQLGSVKRTNICLKCELVGDDLLSCNGGCLQSFHPACIKLEVIPSPEETFICDDCKNDTHPCSICDKRNTDEGLGEIKRCNVLKCGRSYHTSCLQSRKLSIIAGDDEEKINKGERHSLLNSQRCTLHHCATCASKGGDENYNNTQTNLNKRLMFRCVRCPTAYHSGDECIAAGSLILPGLNIVCPEHFEPMKTIPHHQPVHVSCCFVCSKGGELVCCESCPAAFHPSCVELDKLPEGEWFCRDCQFRRRPLYGDIVWVKLGSYRWWPGEITHPNEIPDNIQRLQHSIGEFVVKFFGSNDFFWLNKRRVFAYQEGDKGSSKTQRSRGISTVFNKAIKEAQMRFEELSQHRKKLKEIKTQKKRPSYKHIKVNKPVGNVQVHTADQSEINRCICKRTDLHPCGPESECLNRMLMFECRSDCCPAGDKCENQRFQRRDYPTSEVFKTSWGGWGLRTKVNIKKGEFVNEYVGELVDNEECLRRIEEAHKNNVTNFYMLTIDKDRIIDAGPKGNYSRFMNHCCDPTCETQKWTINGDTRVGLFARKDLKEGDELTFNYNLDCLGNDKTPCMCGSENCSGFIGVRPKPQMNGQNGNRQKVKKKKRLEARLVPKHDDFCFRCRDLGTLVCCDVRTCERAFCLSCLRLTKPPFGKWECPWHHCDFCGRRAQSFCHFCPNSFCGSHVRNQLFPSVPNKYDCCTDHDPNVAEYDMEEAISNAVQSMLPQENWNDSLEVKDESSPSPPTPVESSSSNIKPHLLQQQLVQVKQKRGRPKKIENGIVSSPAIKSNQEATETDSDDLAPMTSSPVRRKRVKKQYNKKNKRLKSNFASKAKPQTKPLVPDTNDVTATITPTVGTVKNEVQNEIMEEITTMDT